MLAVTTQELQASSIESYSPPISDDTRKDAPRQIREWGSSDLGRSTLTRQGRSSPSPTSWPGYNPPSAATNLQNSCRHGQPQIRRRQREQEKSPPKRSSSPEEVASRTPGSTKETNKTSRAMRQSRISLSLQQWIKATFGLSQRTSVESTGTYVAFQGYHMARLTAGFMPPDYHVLNGMKPSAPSPYVLQMPFVAPFPPIPSNPSNLPYSPIPPFLDPSHTT